MIPSFKNIAAALAAASVAQASPIAEHHAHKRDNVFVTVQTTYYVTAGQQVVPSTSSTAAAAVKTTSAEAAVSSYTETAATGTSSASIFVAASSSSSASGSSATSSVGSSGAKGITYSPYNSDGSCKSASEVASDVSELSGFDLIRLYGVDCDQVANVYAAKSSSQKLFLGVYYMDAISSAISTMNTALSGNWDDVYTVAIGNELVNSGEATVSQVASYLSEARTALASTSYTGPVVSTDTWIAVINNPGLCDLSDYIAVNAHAYFDGGVTSDEAGTWLLEQIQRTYEACSGTKSVMITESGWPSQGNTNGKAVASESDQSSAISSIKSTCGNDVILFTAFNDLWKSPGSYGVEQYWGILN